MLNMQAFCAFKTYTNNADYDAIVNVPSLQVTVQPDGIPYALALS